MLDKNKTFRWVPLGVLTAFVSLAAFACSEDAVGAGAAKAGCGNGVLEPGEECEGFDLRGQTCDSVGLSVGRLACNAQCKLDTSGCGGTCGDGQIQKGEACDGANLNGATCASLLGEGSEGAVTCSSDCRSFVTDGCRSSLPLGALAPCTPGAVSTCPAPTTCATTGAGAFCIEPCQVTGGASGACGANRYCEDVGGGVGACATIPRPGMGCTARSGCSDATNTCIPTFLGKNGPISTCAPACPATEVGKGRGSCAAGSSCVAVLGGPLEIEKDATCTVATEATDCNIAEGFACHPMTVGNSTTTRCARPYGQCAPVLPLFRFDGKPADDEYVCDRLQPTRGAAKCGLISERPLPNPARVECAEHFPGVTEVGVCIAFCDGAVLVEGRAGASAPDGTCGDGSTCKVPSSPGYFLPQAETPVPCTETERARCLPAFDRCLDLGKGLECARAVRICVPN